MASRYRNSSSKKRIRRRKVKAILTLILLVSAYAAIKLVPYFGSYVPASELSQLEYDGEIAVTVDHNKPDFDSETKKRAETEVFEEYSELDSLGRCGAAEATVCRETMPEPGAQRESLYSVTPSGWQRINFWTRAHLLGYQLCAENANEKNLITGTERMNVVGMLPYENEVASYVRMNKGKHVLMKVEPVFQGRELVARGVHMQAWSVEDKGRGVSYNVYVFNIQPGYIIDYDDGNIRKDSAHQSSVKIESKSAKHTGRPVSIDEAETTGSTGEVRYIYYTDRNLNNKTAWKNGAEDYGMPPADRGHYYVIAILEGDNWYPRTVSKVKELIIY